MAPRRIPVARLLRSGTDPPYLTDYMSPMLKLSAVSKRFGSLLANDNLSMHLNAGEALGVIGPNGSGKTTMFNILTGITKADQGQGFFQGSDITHLPAFERCRRGIARSFQIPHPFARIG